MGYLLTILATLTFSSSTIQVVTTSISQTNNSQSQKTTLNSKTKTSKSSYKSAPAPTSNIALLGQGNYFSTSFGNDNIPSTWNLFNSRTLRWSDDKEKTVDSVNSNFSNPTLNNNDYLFVNRPVRASDTGDIYSQAQIYNSSDNKIYSSATGTSNLDPGLLASYNVEVINNNTSPSAEIILNRAPFQPNAKNNKINNLFYLDTNNSMIKSINLLGTNLINFKSWWDNSSFSAVALNQNQTSDMILNIVPTSQYSAWVLTSQGAYFVKYNNNSSDPSDFKAFNPTSVTADPSSNTSTIKLSSFGVTDRDYPIVNHEPASLKYNFQTAWYNNSSENNEILTIQHDITTQAGYVKSNNEYGTESIGSNFGANYVTHNPTLWKNNEPSKGVLPAISKYSSAPEELAILTSDSKKSESDKLEPESGWKLNSQPVTLEMLTSPVQTPNPKSQLVGYVKTETHSALVDPNSGYQYFGPSTTSFIYPILRNKSGELSVSQNCAKIPNSTGFAEVTLDNQTNTLYALTSNFDIVKISYDVNTGLFQTTVLGNLKTKINSYEGYLALKNNSELKSTIVTNKINNTPMIYYYYIGYQNLPVKVFGFYPDQATMSSSSISNFLQPISIGNIDTPITKISPISISNIKQSNVGLSKMLWVDRWDFARSASYPGYIFYNFSSKIYNINKNEDNKIILDFSNTSEENITGANNWIKFINSVMDETNFIENNAINWSSTSNLNNEIYDQIITKQDSDTFKNPFDVKAEFNSLIHSYQSVYKINGKYLFNITDADFPKFSSYDQSKLQQSILGALSFKPIFKFKSNLLTLLSSSGKPYLSWVAIVLTSGMYGTLQIYNNKQWEILNTNFRSYIYQNANHYLTSSSQLSPLEAINIELKTMLQNKINEYVKSRLSDYNINSTQDIGVNIDYDSFITKTKNFKTISSIADFKIFIDKYISEIKNFTKTATELFDTSLKPIESDLRGYSISQLNFKSSAYNNYFKAYHNLKTSQKNFKSNTNNSINLLKYMNGSNNFNWNKPSNSSVIINTLSAYESLATKSASHPSLEIIEKQLHSAVINKLKDDANNKFAINSDSKMNDYSLLHILSYKNISIYSLNKNQVNGLDKSFNSKVTTWANELKSYNLAILIISICIPITIIILIFLIFTVPMSVKKRALKKGKYF